jgi:nucleotide-binding universal stress UspA family protein
MYKVIMVPTDGSGFDREAIRVALRLAERCGAQIRLVRVLATGSFFGASGTPDGTPIAPDLARSERDRALSELYSLAAECRTTSKADISVDLHAGPVNDVLQGYARRNDVDLIVISTHARSGISRLSLGSVTEVFRRILVPLDGSTLAEQILPRVLTLASLEDAEITLLNVLVPQSYSQREIVDASLPWWDKDVAVVQAYLFRIAGRLRRAGVLVTTDIVISDNIAGAIGDFASREKANLIAIATHGRGGLNRMLHGSVADAVMHSGRISMLVFKPDKTAEQEVVSSPFIVEENLLPA